MKVLSWISVLLGLAGAFATCGKSQIDELATKACTVKETTFHGWKSFSLENGLVKLDIVPAIGGRIMSYNLGDYPFLYVKEAEFGKLYNVPESETQRVWHNYGGYKTWPAPQSRWGGPPDPLGSFLDGGRYTGRIVQQGEEVVEVEVVSPKDTLIGIQFTRSTLLRKGTTRVILKQKMTNVVNKAVTWSIWDVTQVRGKLREDLSGQKVTHNSGAWAYFPLNPKSIHPKGFIRLDGKPNDSQWYPNIRAGIFGIQYQFHKSKVGADVTDGWIAYVNQLDNYVFVQRFTYFPEKEYPDGGCSAEIWTDPNFPYMETEVLSPLVTLQPGESYSFDVEWVACRCAGPVIAVNDYGVVSQHLSLKKDLGSTSISGIFGVYTPGQAVLIGKDEKENVLVTEKLGTVSPFEMLTLNRTISLPQEVTTLEIAILNLRGERIGILDKLAITGDNYGHSGN
ncbi:DUF4380 domain-containing protein [bacterium]|nr:DUF4380 domain-containing protein [bacterium]